MVTLDWDLERSDGVTLVRVYVTADHRRRVRVENRLDGPAWPPREAGQPAAGWGDGGFDGVVTPEHRLVVGYASPAPPDEPPAAVVSDEPAHQTDDPGPVSGTDRENATRDSSGLGNGRPTPDGGAASPSFDSAEIADVERTPGGVVRSLGDPVVPRDAVPLPETVASPHDAAPDTATAESRSSSTIDGSSAIESSSTVDGSPAVDDSTAVDDTAAEHQRTIGSSPSRFGDNDHRRAPTDELLIVPGTVRRWLADVEQRLDTVERRGEDRSVDPTTTRGLDGAIVSDREALNTVAERAATLAERTDRLTVGRDESQRPEER